ncbi:NADAR domain-containing protein [Profundibacter sp.]|uniref:NADAR domain-containing protein n=1 Tax=Profundibacter sp. TaxID=3101071 RepID=UPI003D0D09BC
MFLKTKERFGGLSNMAPGFPLRVNGVRIRTSEALYQACRFPHMPEVQRLIINQRSPMTAKMRSKPYRKVSRTDWNAVRVKIMRWSLRVKLAQNWSEFGRLLLATGDRPIVEQSRKDDFWGAKVAENGALVGMNVLGRLLMELRELLKSGEPDQLHTVETLEIPEFLLFEQPIQSIGHADEFIQPDSDAVREDYPDHAVQPSLFDQQEATNGLESIQGNHPERLAGRKVIKPYPAYRDSGLPWLGEVPEHWDVRRNGRLFAQRNETGFDELPILEVSLRTGVGVRDFENGSRKQQMTDRSKYKRAAMGDIAYNMMRMWQGAVGVAPEDGLISPAYVVARPFPEVEPRYYAYLFRTKAYMREVNKFSRGIVSDRNRLYWDDFKQMPSPFPPTREQTHIADFLDTHGSHTARLIRNKRRLIALLNEQKQGIINRAVTRGLDPAVPMKPTGIDWMPEVPAHWEIRKIKQVATFNPSRAERTAKFSEDEEVVFLPMENVSVSGDIDCGMRGKVRNLRTGYTYFKRHDVVVAKITPCFENGKGAYLGNLETEIGFGTTEFIVLRANQEINPQYLYEVSMLHVFRRDGKMAMTGAAGQQRVPLSFMREFLFGLPKPHEQREILDYIQAVSNQFNQKIKKAKSEISLTLEYRERLIADVVTGKLDVRGVDLPELDADAATPDISHDAAHQPAEVDA